MAEGTIRIGIGGWVFEDWRGAFYPDKLPHKRELEYASSKLTSIEINGTFYRTQKPETFARWHDETPESFVFSLKGPRYATNRKVLADAGDSIEIFLSSGITELKDKLGPINWQLAPTKQFEEKEIEGFLKLLPKRRGSRALRHAIEVRHESFRNADFIAMAREHSVAVVVAGDSEYPQIADPTADFVYARIMGTSEKAKAGYGPKALDEWAARARTWAQGGQPGDLDTIASAAARAGSRDVFLYVISGYKARNPAAAMELVRRLG